MKKIKTVFLALAILISISATVNAQTSSKKVKTEKPKMEMKMKDGVIMSDNKVMLCKDNKCTPLTETFTCTDGCKVSVDGTVTKPDGMTMKLSNGNGIDKDGKMAMIPYGQTGHVCGPECAMHQKM